MVSSGQMLFRSLLQASAPSVWFRQAGGVHARANHELLCATFSPRLLAAISSQLTFSTQQGNDKQPQPSSTATSTSETASSADKSTANGQSSADEPSSSSSSERASSSSSSSGTGWAHSFSQNLKDGFEKAKSRFQAQNEGSSSQGNQSASSQTTAQRLLKAVVKELKDAILPVNETISVTRVYEGPVADQSAGYTGPSDLVLAKHKEMGWQKVWADISSKFAHHPLFQRLPSVNLTNNPTYKKAEEMADNLRERWETADHPIVHTVEDVRERYFAPSEAARAMKEILTRDPDFNMDHFIRALRSDAPVLVKAFLLHDIGTLSKHCGPELIERFSGIFRHFNEQGLHEDPTILFTSDVELVEMRMVDDDPLVLVRFNCQQLRCTRDKFGNVVEGSIHDIQRVFYFWGLMQERERLLTADNVLLPPRWVIKDMMWQSMLALV